MNPKDDSSLDITIPKQGRTIIHRPLRAATTSHNTRNIFSSKKLDRETKEYTLTDIKICENDPKLRDDNPGLLAIRNKTAKSKTRPKPMRPVTAILDQITLMPSLLNQRPISPAKSPKHSAVQFVQKIVEDERATLSFAEDPVAYFAKHKDGSGHRFIYLNYAMDRNDPNFSPYELKKVPLSEINPEYFTMSTTGVTRILPDGNTEQVSLDNWAKESAIFISIMKLKTFSLYYHWKPFRLWRRFVMRQRFDQLSGFCLSYPLFRQHGFIINTIKSLFDTADPMLKKYLLSIIPQKKFTLEEYNNIIVENHQNLLQEYTEFVNGIVGLVLKLYKDIMDPSRTLVKDSDFQEIQRRNPNLGQLIVLEQKIDAERRRRTEMVESEVHELGLFIRMHDYILLEYLAKSCLECWQIALDNISSDMSAVFQIEISFTKDGQIQFSPSLPDLISRIESSLKDALDTAAELPRLIYHKKMVNMLVDNRLDIELSGPDFYNIIESNTGYEEYKKEILEIVTESYNESELSCQNYTEFYSIFELGKTWDSQDYIKLRGGDETEYNLSQIIGDNTQEVLYIPSKQEIVDFQVVRRNIERIRVDEQRLNQFRACTVRGALFIDSRNLRNMLTPIPVKALKSIEDTLNNLIQKKTDDILEIFNFCSRKLKKEPASLEQYVDYCEFTKAVEQMTPLIAQEISFVDELRSLFEDYKLNLQDVIDQNHNPLHDGFRVFKEDQGIAKGLKDLNADKFVVVLQKRLRMREQKLQKYNVTIMSYPLSISAAKMDVILPKMRKTRAKLEQLEPEIVGLQKCQAIMNVQLHDLSIFKDIKSGALFTEALYESIVKYQDLQDQVQNVPFSSVHLEKFCEDAQKLDQELFELRNSGRPPNSLLNEVFRKLNDIIPYLDSLTLLANGKLQPKHWAKLFDECGKSQMYCTPQLTIYDLLHQGIAAEKEKIVAITSTSKGESQLETDFTNIKNKWQEAQLPLLDSQIKTEDSLLLADLGPMFQEIGEAQAALQTMLDIPYVQSIKKDIISLSQMLENYAQVMDAWLVFQSNWTILASFFGKEETKTILESQAKKFALVKRRWTSLIRHTLENTTLFHVCGYPSLLDMLIENNKILETVLAASLKFIDSKRQVLPRLYFLSNDEVLTLFSTIDFATFNHHLVKLFMHIKNFDFHSQESTETVAQVKISNVQDFSRLKIFGMVGDTTDTLVFNKNVPCGGPVEKWVSDLIDQMKSSVRHQLAESVQRYNNSPLNDWMMAVSMYIGILTIQIAFTTEIDDCFMNYESNSRVFSTYETILTSKIQDLTSSLASPLAPNELMKISAIITLLNSQINITRSLAEKVPAFSQKMNWNEHLKMRFNPANQSLQVEYGETLIEHGYEFWGSIPKFIHTPSSMKAEWNICNSMAQNQVPYLFGSQAIGKKHLISRIASYYGRFIYFLPTFRDKNSMILERVFTGVQATECWLVLHDIQLYSEQNLCYIYDNLRKFMEYKGKNINSCPTQILLTGNSSMIRDNSFPHQLRSLFKPIAFAAPDIRMIAEIMLTSLGFKAVKHISTKLHLLLTTVPYSISEIPVKFTLSSLSKIINNAHKLLRFIMYSKNSTFINYYEASRTAEEYVVARSSYIHYSPILSKISSDIFLQLLYTHFQIFEDFGTFTERIINPKIFEDEVRMEILEEAISDVVENRLSEELKGYIKQQAINLYQLLESYPAVAICGPPKSGKSLVLEVLADAMHSIYEDDEINTKFEAIMPFKVFDIYHLSEYWSKMYGEMKKSKQNGDIWMYGEFHSYFHNVMMAGKNHHAILRFNGPITPKFAQFISQVIGSDDKCLYRLNTMDTLFFNDNFHLIFETDNISNILPSSFSRLAILNMKNISYRLAGLSDISMQNVDIVFRRATAKYNKEVSPQVAEIMHTLFLQIAPQVVEYFLTLPNKIYYAPENIKVPDGEIIITDQLPYETMLLAYLYIDHSNIHDPDQNQLKTILILSFFLVFSAVLDPKEMNQFDTWIRSTYIIEIPGDWVGFNVPDHFWDIYPRPSLESLRFYKGKLIPLDYALIADKPIINKRCESPTMKLATDVACCTAQFLPLIFEGTILVRNKKNFLLYGPRFCGKSSLLKYLFNHNDDIIPVKIPVTRGSTGKTLQQFISYHTPIITKSYVSLSSTKTYALIFDNIPEDNEHALEFIRMIAAGETIPFVSRKDPKFLDLLKIRNFFIIVTTQTFHKLPSRFVSEFIPLHLSPPPNPTISYIIKTVSLACGVSTKISEAISKFALTFMNDPEAPFHYSHLLDAICLLEGRAGLNERDYVNCVKCLLFELKFVFYHRVKNDATKAKFKELFTSLFLEKSSQELYHIIEDDDLVYPDITMASDNSSCHATIRQHRIPTLRDDMKEALEDYNKTHHNTPLDIRFYRPILSQWVFLNRVLSIPGGNAIIRGFQGSGRLELTKLICHAKEMNFHYVHPLLPTQLLSHNARRESLKGQLAEVIHECVMTSKPTCIFMKLTPKSMQDLRILSQEFEFFDISPLFDDVNLDNIYYKFSSLYNIPHDNRLATFQQICLTVRNKLHFIISLDENYEIPNLPLFNPLFFGPINDKYYETCVADQIRMTVYDTPDFIPDGLPVLLTKIHHMILEEFPNTSLNQFYDFIKTFVDFATQNHSELMSKHCHISKAINFITKLDEELAKIQDRIDELGPMIAQLQSDDASIRATFLKKKEAFNNELTQLDDDERLLKVHAKQMADDLIPLRNEMININVKIDLAKEKFEQLTYQNLENLKEETPAPIKWLMEFYCILLDQPAQFEPYGKRLLYDPNFLQIVLEQIKPNELMHPIILKARSHFNQSTFTESSFDAISPTATTLYEWAESVYKFAFTTDKLNEKTMEYDAKNNELTQFIEKAKNEKETISGKLQKLDLDQKNYMSSVHARENLEREYAALENRRRNLDALFKGLDVLGEKWGNDQDSFPQNKRLVIGNSIIYACYLSYFGYMTPSKRLEMLNDIFDEMKVYEIIGNFSDPIGYVSSQLAIKDTQVNNLEDIETDIRVIKAVTRIPLIIDPDGIAVSYLEKSIKPSVVVSMLSSNFDQVVQHCIKDKTTLFIHDVNWTHPLFTENIPIKVFLITSITKVSDIPKTFYSRTNVIDISTSSLKAVEELITNCYVNFFDPEMIPRLQTVQRAELQHNLEIMKYEKETLEGIAAIVEKQTADENFDFMDDEQAAGNLMQSKECYFAAMNVSSDFRSIMNELRMTIEPFSRHIKLCHVFWETMTRYMPNVRSCNAFVIDDYIRVIKTSISSCGFNQGILQPNQHPILHSSIINHVMKFTMPSLPFKDSIFFLCISSFLLKKYEGKAKDSDLESMLQHFNEEFDAQCDFKTIDTRSGDSIDQLKYSNIVHIFTFMCRFISEHFGHNFENFLQPFTMESFITPSPNTPLLIQIRHQRDPTPLLEYYITIRHKVDIIVPISLTDDEFILKQALKTVENAQETGKMVIVHYESTKPSIAAFLYDITNCIKKPHQNFRLIIVCANTDSLSKLTLQQCVRLEYEVYPSIKHQMLEIFQHHSSSIQASTQKSLKKISYAVSLTFALLRYRSFIQPIGFIQEILNDEMIIKDVISQIKKVIDNLGLSELPIRNIRDHILDIDFGAAMIDQYDMRKLKSHIYAIGTPDVLEDGFAFIDTQSEELDKWTIPGDTIQVQNYVHFIEKMPVFPSGDILSMNKFIAPSIRSWNLSRWAMKPFLRLYSNESETEGEVVLRIQKLQKLLPSPVNPSEIEESVSTPLQLFLINEIKLYNVTVLQIDLDLKETLKNKIDIYYEIAAEKVPVKWKILLGYNGTSNLNKFFTILVSKCELLTNWMKNGVTPPMIDIRLISNIKGLLLSYINEIAFQRQSSADVLSYEFVIGDDQSDSGLKLTEICLIGGNWDKNEQKLMPPNNKTPSVIKLPTLACVPVKSTVKQPHAFMCPLYKSIHSYDFMLPSEKTVIDGQFSNYICSIPIKTEIVDRQLITTGTCLVCHRPDFF